MKRTRTALRSTLVSLAVTMLILLLGELMSRAAAYGHAVLSGPHPRVLRKWVPDQEARDRTGWHWIRINSSGFLGPDLPAEKPEGGFRAEGDRSLSRDEVQPTAEGQRINARLLAEEIRAQSMMAERRSGG